MQIKKSRHFTSHGEARSEAAIQDISWVRWAASLRFTMTCIKIHVYLLLPVVYNHVRIKIQQGAIAHEITS
ncbi:MAG: hypothetical protein GW778_02230 [Alphaproteobacteria bacterium]|nr:hypothetical protein [Alphaproteobacteria bacterium]